MRIYSSIENSYREKYIAAIRDAGGDKVEWVATEKLHGCSLSLQALGGAIRPCSRNQITDGSFYACQPIIEELSPKFIRMGKTAIFGELFGTGIQKGISYGPKRFAAFDIVDTDYIDYDDFVSLCDAEGVLRCHEVARGSLDELLALDPSFPTRMSSVDSGHIAEGFVMKPVKTIRLAIGERVILKQKSPDFSERAKEPKTPKESIELNDNQRDLFHLFEMYANEARLSCVLSKMHNLDYQSVYYAFLSDIRDEVAKDVDIDESTWDSLKKNMGNAVNPLIRKELFSK